VSYAPRPSIEAEIPLADRLGGIARRSGTCGLVADLLAT